MSKTLEDGSVLWGAELEELKSIEAALSWVASITDADPDCTPQRAAMSDDESRKLIDLVSDAQLAVSELSGFIGKLYAR